MAGIGSRRRTDTLGRLDEVVVHKLGGTTYTEPETTEYFYDVHGNVEEIHHSNGVISDYQYDKLNRVELLRHYIDEDDSGDYNTGDTLLGEFHYNLAANGRVTGVTEAQRNTSTSSPTLETTRIDWLYDNLGRVVGEAFNMVDNAATTTLDEDTLDYIARYAYDLVGNRLEKATDHQPAALADAPATAIDNFLAAGTFTPDERIDYAYDNNDRLSTEKHYTGATVDRTTVYGYNATQQISKTVWEDEDTDPGTKLEETTYEYNLQGRMSATEINSDGDDFVDTRIEYEYDASGIRVAQTETVDPTDDGNLADATTERTEYLVDHQNPTGYAQVLEERADLNADDNITANEVVRAYALGLDVIGHMIAANADMTILTAAGVSHGDFVRLLYDAHGSTRGLIDATGTPLSQQIYRYDAFGNRLDSAVALTSLLYSGELTDGTGLQYLRARYYDPATGRFNRVDPFAGDLNDPISLHKYLYCHANPVNFRDPSGLAIDAMEIGKAAHFIISVYYRLEHLGDWTDAGIRPWIGLPRLLPDITNFTQKTMAEIKTICPTEIRRGQIKLMAYLVAANSHCLAGSSCWGPDLWVPKLLKAFWVGAVNPTYKDWFGYIAGNHAGVITYGLFRKNDVNPVSIPVEEIVKETTRALQRWRLLLISEEVLIGAYLAQAAQCLLYGTAAVFTGMGIVRAADALAMRPSPYQGVQIPAWIGQLGAAPAF